MKKVIIKKLSYILSSHDKNRLWLLMIPMTISALVSALGVAFIMPFVAALSDQSVIYSNHYMSYVYQAFNFSNPLKFIVFLGFCSIFMLLASNSIVALTAWLSTKVSERVAHNVFIRLYSKYINQPYEYHLSFNSSTLCNNLFVVLPAFVDGYLRKGVRFISSAVSIFFMLSLVVTISPKLALISAVGFGLVYSCIYLIYKGTLNKSGEIKTKNSYKAYKIVNESFGGIKDVKLKGNEDFFIAQLSPSLDKIVKSNTIIDCVSTIPKSLVEAVTLSGVILGTLVMIYSGEKISSIFPILSAFLYSGYRLLPMTQQAFSSFSVFKSCGGYLDSIYESIKGCSTGFENKENVDEKIQFKEKLEIKNMSYQYPNASTEALKNINLTIENNTTVGIIGSTGSGKTTLIDVILGLLNKKEGSLISDGVKIDSNERLTSWKKMIGYVPQFIYLMDSTIKENIAFGEGLNDLDMYRIQEAAKAASIHDFILNDLPAGYNTIVGERGVRLSGGQIQRIGIARALYKKPSILVLDEATSSLDVETEKVVMQEIYKMQDKITILIVAHRLSTVSSCNKVIMMSKGRIIDEGSFEQLERRHAVLEYRDKKNTDKASTKAE